MSSTYRLSKDAFERAAEVLNPRQGDKALTEDARRVSATNSIGFHSPAVVLQRIRDRIPLPESYPSVGLGSIRFVLSAVGLVIAFQFNSFAFADYLSDTDPHPTPDIPRPEYLTPIIDSVFGTTVVRITDAGQPIYNPTGDPSLQGLTWGAESGHAYSSRVSWNADQSLLMIEKGVGGQVFLDGETYEPLFQASVPGKERWHPVNPDQLLFVDDDDHCVGGYDVWSDTTLWQRCFGGYESLEWSDPGKAKPSIDGNIVPLRAQRSSDDHWVAFLYYIDSDTVSAEIDMTPFVEAGDDPDFTMSPLGDTIIINGCIVGHSGRCQAQVALDVETQQELWRVLNYHDPGHSDEVVDEAGEQWRVGKSKEGIGGTIKRNFRTGEAVQLSPYGASHTSTRAILGPLRAILSFHNSSGPFQNEIVGVCLDGSCLERYAHTHRICDGRYLAESHASVSPNGDQIIFRSNWDEDQGLIDAYVIDLGPTAETAPTVTITAPADGSSFDEGNSIAFIGTADDAEDGGLTPNLAWLSDLDGSIGSGGSFSGTLSAGTHTITASVTDSGGLTGSAQVTVTVNAAPVAIDVRVSASSDDAEEWVSGYTRRSNSDLELVYDAGGHQTVGMRFNGVTIPPGSTILDAFVQFQADEVNTVATSLSIQGEATDNASTFISSNGNITSRPRTTAAETWSPAPWTKKGEQGPDQRTPDIASVIQEIVDRPGWSTGNSLVIIISGTGERTAEAFDGVPSAAPLLHVEYVAPGS